jgi:hypothetical protein
MRLGDVLRKWRLMREEDLRTSADRFGISAATLSRIETGGDCDGKTLAKILNFLMSPAVPVDPKV